MTGVWSIALMTASLMTTTTGDLFHLFHKHGGHKAGPPPAAYEIRKMQCDPNWRNRDNAAAALRGYCWQDQPEIVDALIGAMLKDPHEEVREEAAESLAKLAPCMPQARDALACAARNDPDHAVRKWASKGLNALARRCASSCRFCHVEAVPLPVPASYQVPVRVDAGVRILVPPPSPYAAPRGRTQFEQHVLPETSDRAFTVPLPPTYRQPTPTELRLPAESPYRESAPPALEPNNGPSLEPAPEPPALVPPALTPYPNNAVEIPAPPAPPAPGFSSRNVIRDRNGRIIPKTSAPKRPLPLRAARTRPRRRAAQRW